MPRAVEVASTSGFMPTHDAASVSSVIPMDAHIHHWGLDFKQSSLGHIRRVPKRIALDASRRPPRFRHALVPSRFHVQVSRQTQEPPSSSSPLHGGYNEAPHGAHRTCEFPRIRLSSDLCRERAGLSPMDVVMAGVADDKGFASAAGHDGCPCGLGGSGRAEFGEAADVVRVHVSVVVAELAAPFEQGVISSFRG